MTLSTHKQSGFALVELLIMVVVIGILATVTYSYYSGSGANKQKPATVKNEALTSVLQSDLANASTTLRMFFAEGDKYPESLDINNCSIASSGAKYCLRGSKGIVFEYFSTNPYQTYILIATDPIGTRYRLTNDTAPTKISK